MILRIVSIYWSLKHVDVRGYLMAGLIMLVLIMVMSCLIMLVDTILLENSLF